MLNSQRRKYEGAIQPDLFTELCSEWLMLFDIFVMFFILERKENLKKVDFSG